MYLIENAFVMLKCSLIQFISFQEIQINIFFDLFSLLGTMFFFFKINFNELFFIVN